MTSVVYREKKGRNLMMRPCWV